jgi:hypothetical protein
MNRAQIGTIIKTIQHPEPQKLTELWARIVLKEILKRELEKGLIESVDSNIAHKQ